MMDNQSLKIKISDFGLAKIVGDESFLHTLCGTPNYVAPEVLNPLCDRNYTKAVDMWSCGVMLYVCLSGTLPFSGKSIVDV
jgi:serine/threonine-protein kinase Chk2